MGAVGEGVFGVVVGFDDEAVGAAASLSPPERTFPHSHQTSAISKSSVMRCVQTMLAL